MKNVIIFVLGAAAGSLLTWKLIEDKYKKLADEEIEAVRDYYKNREDEVKKLDEFDHIRAWKDTPEVKFEDRKLDPEYKTMIDELGYTEEEMEELAEDPDVVIEHSDEGYEVFIEPTVERIEPYLISPDEYGDKNYELKTLSYYADFVLVDDVTDEIISDPEDIIGNALSRFGELSDDDRFVFVRNDNVECDYEILKEEKTFGELKLTGVDVE